MREGEVEGEKVKVVADFVVGSAIDDVSGDWLISSDMAACGVGGGSGFAKVGERSCLERAADAEVRKGEEGEEHGDVVGRTDGWKVVA